MPSVRRLTAILAADVAGYSRLMGADEEGTHERLKAHRRALVDPKIAEHHGRIVKTTGDGMLVEFPSVVDAVRCAVEVQRGMVERNAETAENNRISFRVGVNLGDVIAEEDDIFGDGVNIAARLEALAEPGGICISRVVRDQIRDKLNYPFEDRGEQSVKNIARPVRVYALRPEATADPAASRVRIVSPGRRRGAIAAMVGVASVALVIAVVAWWIWPATRSSPTATVAGAPATASIAQPLVAPRLSTVVLPFANISNDPDQQYFADGITEDLTTDLSRIAGMVVISRNTAFTYRNKPVDARQIGRDLGVRYVLEGSVQRSGNQLRVTAQLIDAATDTHLWAERFDRDMGDLFALQNEITGRIANALGVELIAAEAAQPTENPDALDYILRGRAAWNKGPTRDNYAQAISLFECALALDPRSVDAQIWLASALVTRVTSQLTDSATADIARAEGLIGQILAAAPRNPLAHWVKGQVLRTQGRCDAAIPEFETVIALNRNSAGAYGNLGWCKFLTGSIEEMIPLVEQAVRLSRYDPFIGYNYARIGLAHLLQSHNDEAIVWFEKAGSAHPGLFDVHSGAASAYALKDETERAAAELAEAKRRTGDGRYSSIARLKATGFFGVREDSMVPKIRALFEATYFVGLRKAGMPED
jgi:TolB-like protein/class 3 adenylate cyclase/tetratricopeptide (TPR) repeat protein